MQHEGVGVRAQLRHDERQALGRPAMKATSRDSRSSFATMTGHLPVLPAESAAASCGRRSRASAPLPVSTSVNSAMSAEPSASAKRETAALCASIPRPDRPCLAVDTR
jgi:hypothetical protein